MLIQEGNAGSLRVGSSIFDKKYKVNNQFQQKSMQDISLKSLQVQAMEAALIRSQGTDE